mgnify:CR=1 FL=1
MPHSCSGEAAMGPIDGSNIEAFKNINGNPIFFEKAKGAYLYDADGNEYIDYIGSWGPMIMSASG